MIIERETTFIFASGDSIKIYEMLDYISIVFNDSKYIHHGLHLRGKALREIVSFLYDFLKEYSKTNHPEWEQKEIGFPKPYKHPLDEPWLGIISLTKNEATELYKELSFLAKKYL